MIGAAADRGAGGALARGSRAARRRSGARCCADRASAPPRLDRQGLRDWVHRCNEEGLAGLHDRRRSGASPASRPSGRPSWRRPWSGDPTRSATARRAGGVRSAGADRGPLRGRPARALGGQAPAPARLPFGAVCPMIRDGGSSDAKRGRQRPAEGGPPAPRGCCRSSTPRPWTCICRRSAGVLPPARRARRPRRRRLDGWHGAADLVIPTNLRLPPLPSHGPELQSVESLRQHLRRNRLGLRAWPDHQALVDACCQAWNAPMSTPDRIASITRRASARAVVDQGRRCETPRRALASWMSAWARGSSSAGRVTCRGEKTWPRAGQRVLACVTASSGRGRPRSPARSARRTRSGG